MVHWTTGIEPTDYDDDETWRYIMCKYFTLDPCRNIIFLTIRSRHYLTKAYLVYFKAVFELPGGLGGVEPPTSPCRPPYLWSTFDPGGSSFNPPHLSFTEVGMLFDSHFLLMQFLKYLGLHHDDFNVTTS